MKKCLSLLMAIVLVASCFAVPAFAVEDNAEETTVSQLGDPIYLLDGCCIIIEPTVRSLTRGSMLELSRTATVYNEDMEKTCSLTLKAIFLVNSNNTITCISSLYDTNVYLNGWAVEEPSSTCSDHGTYSVATATALARKRVLGILVKNVRLTVGIKAYSDGSYEYNP